LNTNLFLQIDDLFGSSSSDGLLIIWQSETLNRLIDLAPYAENLDDHLSVIPHLSGIYCFKTLNNVKENDLKI
jgi:hypothetical protein